MPSPPPLPVVNRVRSAAVGSRPEARIADSLLRFAGLDGRALRARRPGGRRRGPARRAGRSSSTPRTRRCARRSPTSPPRRAVDPPRHDRVARRATGGAACSAPLRRQRRGLQASERRSGGEEDRQARDGVDDMTTMSGTWPMTAAPVEHRDGTLVGREHAEQVTDDDADCLDRRDERRLDQGVVRARARRCRAGRRRCRAGRSAGATSTCPW